ncbi:MAG: acetoacetate decarboxylase family protein [Mariniblastus sp.]|nr:acetoacetate decarboxylase family protein [Mariniblastus sp.]
MVVSKRLNSKKEDRGRITESRTDPTWGCSPSRIKNSKWFEAHKYTAGQLSLGHKTDQQYYFYDATGLVIKGHCSYKEISSALAEEGLNPIRTTDGRAFVSIWFNIIRDSVCGEYHEIAISIDATQCGENCGVDVASKDNPFHHLYSNFGNSVCKCQFMHSLYINSPVSIAWGREMQAFPKHIDPVDSMIEDNSRCFESKIQWQNDLIFRASVRKQFGVAQFVKQGLGLVSGIGPLSMLNFLTASQFEVPIQMPQKIARQYSLPSKYLSVIRKGLHPGSVQCWPWGDSDMLELGDVVRQSGSEANNGHDLIRRSDFTPTVVTYLPFMQAYIGEP